MLPYLRELTCHGKILAALLCIIIYEKDFTRKGEIKGTLGFAQSNTQIKSDERLIKSLNSAFRGKHKDPNSFSYLKNQGTYLDRTKVLY